MVLSVSCATIGALTVDCTEILQGICAMEGPSPSERVAAPGSGNDRNEARDGVRVDIEWEHKRVCDSASGCESVRTRELSIRAPAVLTCR